MHFSPSKLQERRREYGEKTGGASLIAAIGRELPPPPGARDASSKAHYIKDRIQLGKPVTDEIGAAFVAAMKRVFVRDVGRTLEESEILEDAHVASGKERTSKPTV